MLVGVSRQSVTKWEAEKSYPEMDKLLKLCQIFECTLDDLVTGDLTDRAIPRAVSVVPCIAPQDSCGYDEHMRRRARFVAGGVALIFAGLGLGMLFQTFAGTSEQAGVLVSGFTLAGIATSLACFIPSALRHSAFKKQHPFIEDFYTLEQKAETTSRCAVGLVVGIVLILLSFALPMLLAGSAGPEGLATAITLLVLGCGVSVIVYAGMMLRRVNVREYNNSAVDVLEAEDIEGLALDQKETARLLERKKRSSRTGSLCGVIMLVATVVGLCLLFFGPAVPALQGVAHLFWMAWVVGGLCCAIVPIVMGPLSGR